MQTIAQIKQSLKQGGFSIQQLQELIDPSSGDLDAERYDEAYMHCLLQPEKQPCTRIPTEFGKHSSVFTQSKTIYVESGPLGEGMFTYLPQDYSYCPGYFISTSGLELPEQKLGLDITRTLFAVKSLIDPKLSEQFQCARTVGACIEIEFCGDENQNTGHLVGSESFDNQIGMLDQQKIDQGYNKVSTDPIKGLRMIYIPRSELDYEYTSLDTQLRKDDDVTADYKVTETTAYGNLCEKIRPLNYIRRNKVNPADNDTPGLYVSQKGFKGQITDEVAELVWSRRLESDQHQPVDYIGTGPRSELTNNPTPQALCFYWKGLPKNTKTFKVTMTRHIEAVPRSFIQQFVSVSRPIHDQISRKVAQQLSLEDSKVLCSTLDEADLLHQHITEAISSSTTNTGFIEKIKETSKKVKEWVEHTKNVVKHFRDKGVLKQTLKTAVQDVVMS